MRDIRADLRERLEIADADAKAKADAADAAAARAKAIREMLNAEEAAFSASDRIRTVESFANQVLTTMANSMSGAPGGGTVAAPGTTVTLPVLSLDDFLVKAVGRGVHDKDELRDAAIRAGYFRGAPQSPGRVVHAKLTNLVREGTLGKNDLLGGYIVMQGN